MLLDVYAPETHPRPDRNRFYEQASESKSSTNPLHTPSTHTPRQAIISRRGEATKWLRSFSHKIRLVALHNRMKSPQKNMSKTFFNVTPRKTFSFSRASSKTARGKARRESGARQAINSEHSLHPRPLSAKTFGMSRARA
jgi:hypothetical protein